MQPEYTFLDMALIGFMCGFIGAATNNLIMMRKEHKEDDDTGA